MDRMIDRLPSVTRLIRRDHSQPVAAAWSAVAVALPLGIRLALDGGAAGVPFLTFFPAILLVALVFGWKWGAVVTVASAIAANRLLLHDPLDVLAPADFLLSLMFFASSALLVATGDLARQLIRRLEAAKGREEMLKHELLHRVKNMLATVSAMEAMTARYSDPAHYREALTGRLDALQRVTTLLAGGAVADARLAKVVDAALAPFRTPDNMTIDGPDCRLPNEACVPLSLALHELCTNAVKYGALSVPEGRVDLRWSIEAAARRLDLVWSEHDGPPVTPPERSGMGTQLLRRQRELGEVDVDYAPSGLVCRLAVRDVTLI